MFMNFRRINKCQCVQMLTAGLVLCVLVICWEELDYHVVRHTISFFYRYLVNNYDFLNSSLAISSDHHSSIDLHGRFGNYPYLINHPKKCKAGDRKNWDDVLLLLIVKSAPENFDRRQAIRETWGNESFVRSELGVSVRLVFAMGVYSDVGGRSMVQNAMLQEDHIHGDLIQQKFVDTFHNLTTKLILQFHWGQMYCPQAHFFMSADDDVFVHMPNLVKYLQNLLRSQLGAKDLWVGHVHRGAPPIRHKDSKYHVPYDLYPWPSYPDYTAGAGYVVSKDVAAKIYQAIQVLNSSLYIDDVFMGMCAKVMGVSPQKHAYFSGEGKAPYHPCIYDHMITSHGHATDVRLLWQAATDATTYSKTGGVLGKLYCTVVRVVLLCLPYYHNTYSCLAAFPY